MARTTEIPRNIACAPRRELETEVKETKNTTPRHSKRLESSVTSQSSISSILFTSSKPSISGDPKGHESEESNRPFDEAREIERRRAPHLPEASSPEQCRVERKKVAYVVFNGRQLGIFYNWEACEMSIIGYSGQRYKGYYTVDEAQDAWEHANAVGTVGPLPAAMPTGPSTHTRFDHVLSDEEAYWAVLQGLNPGVYHGLRSAKRAAGKTNEKVAVVRALTKDEGCRAFTDGYMEGCVAVLTRRTR